LGFALTVVFFPDIADLFVQDRDSSGKSALTVRQRNSTVQLMTDNRMSGAALITGMIGFIITMAFHPTDTILLPRNIQHS